MAAFVWTAGARVRFTSYFGSDYALGRIIDVSVLKYASKNDSYSTTFILEAADKGCFRLQWGGDPSIYLYWWWPNEQLRFLDRAYNSDPSRKDAGLFRVDPVKDGNWFALNDLNRYHVLDLAGSETGQNTKILSWAWNGGDNQVWRTDVVT